MEEESFKVRVDKVFGSLAGPQPPNNNSSDALWSLTGDKIHKREWNRHKDVLPDDDDLSGPFALRPLSKRKSKRLMWAGSRRLIKHQLNEPDEGGLDDNEEEEEEEEEDEHGVEAGPSARMCSKPDDCDDDDDEWIIRSSIIGRDCTLDKEDEEDEFDKAAVGREKTGGRIYMNEIIDYTTYADTFYELPTSVEDVGRDPRANHAAAELRLKEDAQAISELKGSEIVEVRSSTSSTQNGLLVDLVNVRSILKKGEKKAEPKSLKRVRFDPEITCDLNKQASESGEEKRDLLHSPQPDSRVPDYLRNPSKYTQYIFDSTNDLNDEAVNKKAFMDFFSLVRQKRANESQSSEHAGESPNTVTFVPRKRINTDAVEQGNASKRSSGDKENSVRKGACPVSAAADESFVIEGDESETETIPTSSSTARKAQRQYRARAKSEQLDELGVV